MTDIRGKLLFSLTFSADGITLVDSRDDDGNFCPSYRFDELDSITGTQGMKIPHNTVRVCLPTGVTRCPHDQPNLKKDICLQFDKTWPNLELPTIVFPVSNTNKAVNRYVDISITGDAPRPVEVGLKLTSEWKVAGKAFEGNYLLGACLPPNIISIELCGVYAPHQLAVRDAAQSLISNFFDPRSDTKSVVLDVWSVGKEFIRKRFQFDTRMRVVVDVRDSNHKPVSAVAADYSWPGFIPDINGDGYYTTSFINRFPYCTSCTSMTDSLERRHTTEYCPEKKCTRCKQKGHYKSDCPMNDQPHPSSSSSSAPLTSAQRAFPQAGSGQASRATPSTRIAAVDLENAQSTPDLVAQTAVSAPQLPAALTVQSIPNPSTAGARSSPAGLQSGAQTGLTQSRLSFTAAS